MSRIIVAVTLVLLLGSFGCGSPDAPQPSVPLLAHRATQLDFRVQPVDVEAGTPIAPAVEVAEVDSARKLVNTAADTISVSLDINPTNDTLGGTRVAVAKGGIARFDDLRVERPGAAYELRASAPGLQGAVSATFKVIAPSGPRLVFRTVPDHAFAGVVIDPPVEVAVVDASGKPVTAPAVSVSLGVLNDSTGQQLRGVTTVATVGGIARFDNLSIAQPGNGYVLVTTTAGFPRAASPPINVSRPIPFQESAAVAAASASTCALDRNGVAWCWGDDVMGQLGDGRVLSSKTPVAVAGGLKFSSIGLSKFTGSDGLAGLRGGVVDMGESVACGLTEDGVAYCWGGGTSAFNGSRNGSMPEPVAGALRFTKLSTGRLHACALALDGSAWCWGPLAPVRGQVFPPDPLTPFQIIGTGLEHTCALTTAGKAYCWGPDADLTLGNAQTRRSSTPVAVSGGLAFDSLTVGQIHNCGLLQGGDAWCWGNDDNGQLGDGGVQAGVVPVRVQGDHQFAMISAGANHTCAVTRDGQAWCWGGNLKGQLGDGSTQGKTTPVPVAGGIKFMAISAGDLHTCGLSIAGEAWCWGWNTQGTMREGDNSFTTAPVLVSSAVAFRSVIAGGDETCGVAADGAGWCWGDNYGGELGDGHPLYSTVPVRVTGDITFKSLSAAENTVCGVASDGGGWCWGAVRGSDNAEAISSASRIPGAGSFRMISTAPEQACGIVDREVRCWSTSARGTPVPVSGDTKFDAVSLGWSEDCAITFGGPVYCWGYVPYVGDLTVPKRVQGESSFVALGVGNDYACGLKPNGQAYCWGENQFGQLGDGSRKPSVTPVEVVGGLRFKTMSVGWWAACGVTVDEKGYCWSADYNNLGLATPRLVPGNLTWSMIDVSHGGSRGWGGHACGSTTSGVLYCFGTGNDRGQFGNGSTFSLYGPPYLFNTLPTPVVGGHF